MQVQDEIFGPVLSVGKFSTEAEAIKLANDTTYGLGAGLHSSACIFSACSVARMLGQYAAELDMTTYLRAWSSFC